MLLADDSRFVRKKITDIIEKDQDIELLDYAIDGLEAVQMADFYKPDVLLLDLMMPKMNGLKAFEKIMNNYPIPTIILSALNPKDMDISVQALLIGAFDYLIKPKSLDSEFFTEFKRQLISKIKAAYNSRIGKGSKVKEKSAFERGQTLRQQIVNKTFRFGRQLNEISPIGEKEEIKKAPSSSSNKLDIKKQPIPKPKQKKPKRVNSKSKRLTKKSPPKRKLVKKDKEKDKRKEQRKLKIKEQGIKKVISKKKDRSTSKPKTSSKLLSDSKIYHPQFPSKVRKRKEFKSKDFTDLSPIRNVKISSNIIVIGASVGGPRALRRILQNLPNNLSSPILVVQHIQKNFTRSLASNLNQSCKIRVKVAEYGETIEKGVAYISPGEQHMKVAVRDNKPIIKVYKGKPVNYCIPSIDVLFISAARIYKNRTLGILLTGMGFDGVNGLKAIQILGGKTIAESEETSVLYGMPKVAIQQGVVDHILPNYEISSAIKKFLS